MNKLLTPKKNPFFLFTQNRNTRTGCPNNPNLFIHILFFEVTNV